VTDTVYLRGLNVDGVQFGGVNGIVFNTGHRLTIANCVVRHFSGAGILIQPTSGVEIFSITDTVSSDTVSKVSFIFRRPARRSSPACSST